MLEHRFAKLAAIATFILLVIGGTVNPTGSSLACPEPTILCEGQLFPKMVGGVFYEHGHRLAAMTVGLLQIALTVLLFRRRPEMRRLAILLLAMVLVQGLLGAITVKYKLPWFVSTGHLLLGMSYFASLIYTAFRTRHAPSVVELERHDRLRGELGDGRRWIGIACATVIVQLLLGALVRHHGATLVCVGIPACTPDGDWWPADAVQRLHMIHRGFGVVTAVVTTIAAAAVLRRARSWPSLRLLALAAPLLVALQIVLGIYTVLTLRHVPVAVGHFAGATALWGLWISAWLVTGARLASRGAATRDAATVPSLRMAVSP
ncbi:MAG TPA: COX15/CtaA family protein [Kofleriaceae bacterium]|nr:COX15/CtaA family protein [Kofleriaceae bacterium]